MWYSLFGLIWVKSSLSQTINLKDLVKSVINKRDMNLSVFSNINFEQPITFTIVLIAVNG